MKGSCATPAHADLEQDPSAEQLLVHEHKCQKWVFIDLRAGLH